MKKYHLYIIWIVFIFVVSCNEQHEEIKKEGTIKAGDLQLYYERTGKGDAILLLHAGLQDHTMWEEQVKALSKKYEVICIDLPYHGKTTGSDTTLLVQDLVKILLDSLHIQKVSVTGLSMGASVAQDFIIAYPGRVNKAVLIASGINGFEETHPMDSTSMDWWPRFKQALDAKDTAGAAKEFTKAWAEGVYRKGDSLKAPVSQFIYKVTLQNLLLHKMEAWPLFQFNPPAMQSLAIIKIPVLIIHGDKDLPYITESSKYMEQHIPGAKRVEMKGVAHMLNIERPDELNKLLMDFFK